MGHRNVCELCKSPMAEREAQNALAEHNAVLCWDCGRQAVEPHKRRSFIIHDASTGTSAVVTPVACERAEQHYTVQIVGPLAAPNTLTMTRTLLKQVMTNAKITGRV